MYNYIAGWEECFDNPLEEEDTWDPQPAIFNLSKIYVIIMFAGWEDEKF
jgi:hypothetical protein